jgi:tetratricopeptide (TPR) repeat protein
MKKINAFLLIVSLSAVGACYKSGSGDRAKSTTANVSPIADKSVEPANQTSQKNLNSDLPPNDKAVAELEEAVKKDPKNSQAFYQLGKSYQTLKNEEKAVGAYKKAIEIKPDFAEANYELGTIYVRKKDYETALPFMQKAAKVKYTSAEYLVALGDNYRALNRCNYAMPPYGNSLGFDDKNPAAYYGMGLCYIELKNKLAAQSQLRPLEKLDKNLAKDLEAKIAQK